MFLGFLSIKHSAYGNPETGVQEALAAVI